LRNELGVRTNKLLIAKPKYKNQYKNLNMTFKSNSVINKLIYANNKTAIKKGFK
jgi:hypothetical protein